ncbi:hypothetical protein N2V14_004090 [Vibrio fluvialis]|nr:hypothetical protein [Vibrio fluvialis]
MKRQEPDINLSNLITGHVDAYLMKSNIKREAYLKENLLPSLVEAGLLEEPESAEDYQRWVNSQSKKLGRYIDGLNKMNANWVFPILSSLPDEYRRKAMMDLCGFFGTHYVPFYSIDSGVSNKGVAATLSVLSKEFSDVLKRSAPALDGVYDQKDDPIELLQYANEIFELATSCFVELGKINQATGVLPTAYQVMANSPLFK